MSSCSSSTVSMRISSSRDRCSVIGFCVDIASSGSCVLGFPVMLLLFRRYDLQRFPGSVSYYWDNVGLLRAVQVFASRLPTLLWMLHHRVWGTRYAQFP